METTDTMWELIKPTETAENDCNNSKQCARRIKARHLHAVLCKTWIKCVSDLNHHIFLDRMSAQLPLLWAL